MIEVTPSERYSKELAESLDSGSPSLNRSPRKNSSSASGKTISGVYDTTRPQGNSSSPESPADNHGKAKKNRGGSFIPGAGFFTEPKPVRTPVGRPKEFVEIFDREGRKKDAKIIAIGWLNLVFEDKNGEHFVFPTRSLSDQTRSFLPGWEEKEADLQGVIRRKVRLKVGQTFQPWFVGSKGLHPFDGQQQQAFRIDCVHTNGDMTVFYEGKSIRVTKDMLTDETKARLKEYRRMLGVPTN